MTSKEIIAALPYSSPFLFVDEIEAVSKNGITGNYTFKESEFFYSGHFINNPVTPGVILMECMAQIGLVSLGIYLMGDKVNNEEFQIAFTSSQMEFLKPVLPNEKITVISKIEYFRFSKLKCKIKSFDSKKDLVCEGVLSGMLRI